LVFLDRTTAGGAELLQAQREGRKTVSRRVEIILRIPRVRAAERIGGAVKFIGAGLQADVDYAAGLETGIGADVLRRLEFLNGVQRNERLHVAREGRTIN